MNCDVAIIGAGPAGIFSAYKLKTEKPDLKIAVIDKGKNINYRACPMRNNPGSACVNCKPCGIMSGFGGAGTFSDCKLTLSSKGGVGGNLANYVGTDVADNYINQVNTVLSHFDMSSNKPEIIGAEKNFDIQNIERLCKAVNMELSYAPTTHYGTDRTYNIMKELQKHLEGLGVMFKFNTEVHSIIQLKDDSFRLTTDLDDIYTKYVIAAPGRSGNHWLEHTINSSFGDKIKMSHNKVDIGVRVEVPADAVKYLTDNLYDMKLSYTDPVTEDKIRTFCTNPRGYVSEEHYGNSAVVNGHSFADKKSDKTNFALLVTLNNDSLDSEYVYNIVKQCNHITKGKLMFQNYYDFTNKYSYKISDKNKNLTLNTAVEGDLRLVLPARVTKMIDKFIDYFCAVFYKGEMKDIALYGIEAKFYSDRVEMNNKLETGVKNFYCAGDGAGITRGISQSGAMGLIIAENILKSELN